MVTRLALGAPVDALPVPIAPTAPEPLVPVVSTPLKLIRVIEEATLWVRVAVTLTLLRVEVAKARQISEVPPLGVGPDNEHPVQTSTGDIGDGGVGTRDVIGGDIGQE